MGNTGMDGVVVCGGKKARDTAVGQPSNGGVTGDVIKCGEMHDVGLDKELERSALALLTGCCGNKFRSS